jgi:hypothetical protein
MSCKTSFITYIEVMALKKTGLLLLTTLLTASCSARIDGVIMTGGAAELTINTALEPRTIGLIRSIRGFAGDTSDKLILDGPEMSRSMARAPGIRAVSLRNTGTAALAGNISVTKVGDFLAGNEPEARGRFITFNESPGSSSIVIFINMDNAPDLISKLSPEVEEYLSALLAPAVLGEISTRQEYLDLITAVYGRAQAAEISAARILAVIEFPRQVQSVQGGKPQGNKAEFDIPLVDLMVLETPLRYEVRW